MKNIRKDNGAIQFKLNIQTHTLINFHNFLLSSDSCDCYPTRA